MTNRQELGKALEGVFCTGCGQEMRYMPTYDGIEGRIVVIFCPDDEGGGRAKVVLCKGPKCKKEMFWQQVDGKGKPFDVETGLHHYQACNDVEGARAVQVMDTQRARSLGGGRGRRGGANRSARRPW